MTLPVALAVVVLCGAALAWFGLRFHDAQKRGALGGKISRAKAYWLPFAVFFWFVACPLAAAMDVLAAPLRVTLAVFGALMWLRGIAEMVMLYGTKNWRPPYGITHDALCVAQLVGTLAWHWGTFAAFSSLDWWGVALVCLAITSLCVEIHHAWSFFVAVRGQTVGEDGVWFADDDDARFRKINRTTFVWNVVLTIGLAVIFGRLLLALGGIA